MTQQEKKRQENREKRAREKRMGATSYDFYDDDDNDLFFVDDEYTKGYGIKPIETFTGVPSIDPEKMLIRLTMLLSQIYADYSSKEIIKETKRVLDSL